MAETWAADTEACSHVSLFLLLRALDGPLMGPFFFGYSRLGGGL